MALEHLALARTHDFPIRHEGRIHQGKVRSVYWLSAQDSARLIEQKRYQIYPQNRLGVMITSDRISAFDCGWTAKDGLDGVPGKGAALNAISSYWFKRFEEEDLAFSHVVDAPHPLVWIVQQAQPIRIEGVVRRYLTGSAWRAYEKGERIIGGVSLPNHWSQYHRFDRLVFTPTTKGSMSVHGLPEGEDADITVEQIGDHFQVFGLQAPGDLRSFERMVLAGFELAASELDRMGLILADTKFEVGYIKDSTGVPRMYFIDEAGTPDSSRVWPAYDFKAGFVMDLSKEGFRQFLLRQLSIDLLTNKDWFEERKRAAADFRVPVEQFMEVSRTYEALARQITGRPLQPVNNPRGEILDTLSGFGLVK